VTGKRARIGLAALALLVCVWLSVLLRPGDQPGRVERGPSPSAGTSPVATTAIAVGANVVLDGSGLDMKDVTVAISEPDLDQYLEYVRAQDILGTVEMVQRKQVFSVPNGTFALALEVGRVKAKVRLFGNEGAVKPPKYYGRVGWVVTPVLSGARK
jgi:hypothetical protein